MSLLKAKQNPTAIIVTLSHQLCEFNDVGHVDESK